MQNLFNVLLMMVLTAGPVLAQEFVVMSQPCTSPELIIQDTVEFQEQPLFTASGFQMLAVTGELAAGEMMIWVNQDTGTWTMAVAYPNTGLACLMASGHSFQPYVD